MVPPSQTPNTFVDRTLQCFLFRRLDALPDRSLQYPKHSLNTAAASFLLLLLSCVCKHDFRYCGLCRESFSQRASESKLWCRRWGESDCCRQKLDHCVRQSLIIRFLLLERRSLSGVWTSQSECPHHEQHQHVPGLITCATRQLWSLNPSRRA